MVLTADPGALVAAERGVRGVLVETVGPHTTGLDRAAHPERPAAVTSPHAGAEPVQRVVGDLQRLLLITECRHREHRPEDLLLEHPHLVVALEHGRLKVVAAAETVLHRWAMTADQHLSALVEANRDVALDLLQLSDRDLRADHRLAIQRIALPDRGNPCQAALHEL